MEEIKIDFEAIEKAYVGVNYYIQSLERKMDLISNEISHITIEGGEGMDKDKFMDFWYWLYNDDNSIYNKLINELTKYQENLKKARRLYIEVQNFAFSKAREI